MFCLISSICHNIKIEPNSSHSKFGLATHTPLLPDLVVCVVDSAVIGEVVFCSPPVLSFDALPGPPPPVFEFPPPSVAFPPVPVVILESVFVAALTLLAKVLALVSDVLEPTVVVLASIADATDVESAATAVETLVVAASVAPTAEVVCSTTMVCVVTGVADDMSVESKIKTQF